MALTPSELNILRRQASTAQTGGFTEAELRALRQRDSTPVEPAETGGAWSQFMTSADRDVAMGREGAAPYQHEGEFSALNALLNVPFSLGRRVDEIMGVITDPGQVWEAGKAIATDEGVRQQAWEALQGDFKKEGFEEDPTAAISTVLGGVSMLAGGAAPLAARAGGTLGKVGGTLGKAGTAIARSAPVLRKISQAADIADPTTAPVRAAVKAGKYGLKLPGRGLKKLATETRPGRAGLEKMLGFTTAMGPKVFQVLREIGKDNVRAAKFLGYLERGVGKRGASEPTRLVDDIQAGYANAIQGELDLLKERLTRVDYNEVADVQGLRDKWSDPQGPLAPMDGRLVYVLGKPNKRTFEPRSGTWRVKFKKSAPGVKVDVEAGTRALLGRAMPRFMEIAGGEAAPTLRQIDNVRKDLDNYLRRFTGEEARPGREVLYELRRDLSDAIAAVSPEYRAANTAFAENINALRRAGRELSLDEGDVRRILPVDMADEAVRPIITDEAQTRQTILNKLRTGLRPSGKEPTYDAVAKIEQGLRQAIHRKFGTGVGGDVIDPDFTARIIALEASKPLAEELAARAALSGMFRGAVGTLGVMFGLNQLTWSAAAALPALWLFMPRFVAKNYIRMHMDPVRKIAEQAASVGMPISQWARSGMSLGQLMERIQQQLAAEDGRTRPETANPASGNLLMRGVRSNNANRQ